VYASILEEENYELRTENIDVHDLQIVQDELRAVRASFIYRSMKSLATKIDRLFPDNTTRGRLRKRITEALGHK
jgi:hypothetical protein